MFKCEEDSIGRGTWTSAIYKCAVDNSSRLKNNSPYFDYWLPYFIYEEDKGNTQCVAITKDNISRPPTYQFRTCSDRISVLCYDENDSSHLITTVIANRGSQLPAISTEPILDRTVNQTTSNLPSVQKLENASLHMCVPHNKKYGKYNIKQLKHPTVRVDGNSERDNCVSQN
ncbi:Hypothetical predicted protein [Mytilus galloprovincialis]|uniref:Uncharacterized protein n=1 Tax=Mytilus galloprovincialis TaxID=29158 RepID=A0A8B6E051_MYTGA|nr:Hypothetical predicted protein [Mytilus galloprovincialis]